MSPTQSVLSKAWRFSKRQHLVPNYFVVAMGTSTFCHKAHREDHLKRCEVEVIFH